MCGSEFHAYELEYHERLLHLLFDVNLRVDAPERTLSNRNLLGQNQAAADEKFNEEFAPVRTELSISATISGNSNCPLSLCANSVWTTRRVKRFSLVNK
jgi:hypothetical protein